MGARSLINLPALHATLLAVAILLTTAAAAGATQISYIDQGQVWVSTLDGSQKRSISGPAPVVEAGESRSWTEQAQSDDGWIVGVARAAGRTGAASPTRVWNPSGTVTAQSTLGYLNAYNTGTLAVPVQLDLAPGGQQMLYTYSSLTYGYPTSTLHVGTWVTNTSNSSGEPFDIPGLIGSSLVGSRWVGVNHNAGYPSPNIYVEAPGGSGPFSSSGNSWFLWNVPGAWAVDAAANGSAAGVIWRANGESPYVLALFQTQGLDTPVAPTVPSCDVTSSGPVIQSSFSQDGKYVAWQDDAGIHVAGAPVWGSSPCQFSSPPVLISATGTDPSLGPTTLATAPASSATDKKSKGGAASAKPTLAVAKTVKASAFAKGLKITVTVKRKGNVSAVAKVGKATLAKKTVKAGKAGKVKLTLKAPKAVAKNLQRYKGKTVKITVKAPGGTATVKRKLG